MFNSFRTAKPSTMAIMSKTKTTSQVSLKLPSRINLEKQGARSDLSTLDTAHKLPYNL